MPEYLAPGVYVEEISTGPKPIEGVSTSNAGFLGATERGPEYVRLITSWLEFQRWYGSYIYDQSFLPHAVQGFFDNGGKRCFIGRIVGAGATHAIAQIGNLFVSAIGRGTWGNAVEVEVTLATSAEPPNPTQPNWFRVRVHVVRNGNPVEGTQEEYDDLTFADSTNSVVKVINSASKLIRVWWVAAPDRVPNQAFSALAGAIEPNPVAAGDFEGNLLPHSPAVPAAQQPPDEQLGRGRGFVALGSVDEVSLVVTPDEVRNGMANVTTQAILHCEGLKDRFAIASVVQGQNDTGNVRPPQDSTYAAFYYPWIRIYDPSVDDYRLIPPTGHIAGIFARSDIERGVHKAPANEVVRGAANMEFPVTKGMQDILNPRGVNCIRDFRPDGRGIRLWGARTMSSDPEWKYVNVRRLFLFVEESIDEGTQWVVFEPNHHPTWSRVRRSITNFLINVWKSGALMGTTPDEAFFVKCDRTTMTQDDIDNGRLICYIGIAPVKPAEFVIFRISQKTVESQG